MMRRTPLKRQSAKAKRERPALERWEEAVLRRDRYACQAATVWPEVECRGKLKGHHVAQKSVRPDLIFDVDNGLTLCGAHHSAVHADEPLASERGLLRYSWDDAGH